MEIAERQVRRLLHTLNCLSTLHRRDQINMHSGKINMHSGKAPSKPDLSTLRGIGHFYFALTHFSEVCPVDFDPRAEI